MALDYQQLNAQINQLGDSAPLRAQRFQSLREDALEILSRHASDFDFPIQRVDQIARNFDPNLRCAVPVSEALDARSPTPPLPSSATILAADGSQITPDRHAEVEYGLINVGAIWMRHGSPDPPETIVRTNLVYDERLLDLSEAALALQRDFHERKILADLAINARIPVISFTDGQMELWGGRASEGVTASNFQQSFQEYLKVLGQLKDLNVTTAGYVDKSAARTMVRLLEVLSLDETELLQVRHKQPLRSLRDIHIYQQLLEPGERSAVFAIQSRFLKDYPDDIAPHFFYLNVGQSDKSWLARVEIPAWVAANKNMLDNLHAVLIHQCSIMGGRRYPYLLHRAHEVAVVSLQDQQQVTQMILVELHRRGVEVGGSSNKQASKELSSRTRYERK